MVDEQKNINWASVVTTAVSTLVATIVVGAAVMVWNKTANFDNDIANATVDITKNQGILKLQIKTMANEMASLNVKIVKIKNQLDGHEDYLREKSRATPPSKDGGPVFPSLKRTDQDLYKFRNKEVERILNEYQKNVSAIQQQPRRDR